MTNDPCRYCGKHHAPVGGVVCAYTLPFARLANGGHNLVRQQQFFANEIQYDFDWLPPDAKTERNLIEQINIGKHHHNSNKNKFKHYYDTTTKTTNPASRGQH